ncbi:ABC transporter ATP-binding protein [Croceibacter atlanticus]|jgi:peptide/nickel transport system ATP-binding protein|uniref:ABC-type dipeptide transport system, ATPase component n=1 Tax=Croceibacter atlanticus (strain ATCC BAA-628 / JCM 21780 / CIP 108009 / IAM 15332 / KCTC 12090 / HTCC2559) TaxID=216432 RepID=A3U6D4_CROAH|nr:ABC transporter ATP-binding protein [Croceibacter atlanticus]EAP87801.1 ABC-type dipeptide transport system, ATPase component [Croceibacter atlanticus HTCC2559]
MITFEDMLTVQNLTIAFKSQDDFIPVVNNISFDLKPNEILGVVGESGSGKSVSTLAISGLLPKKISKITSGNIIFEGTSLLEYSNAQMTMLRGKEIAMIFQEPMSALNPSMTCGAQVLEIILQHKDITPAKAKVETLQLFEKVKLPRPKDIFKSYPHQISGGQMQRVMIAMAIACKPKILIADEPTTALDVTVQKEIIQLLKELQKETKMSIIFISHDLALVSEIAQRVIVMHKGNIVEEGKTEDIFLQPKQLYTKALIASKPNTKIHLKRLPTVSDFVNNTVPTETISDNERRLFRKQLFEQKPLLEVVNVDKEFYSNAGLFNKTTIVKAVNNVSFKVYEGETLGLVGESGCGKSTLGNVILQLHKATKGKVFYKGEDITKLKGKALRVLRKDIQLIFQDPFSSLNPRITVGKAIEEPMKVHKLYQNDDERKEKVISILKRVGLDASHYYRYPHEFSGGQRQRIGIARTIALQPKLIVCDESVSALDISVQAQVLNLLNELKEDFGFTYIFISHDLSVVKYMADELIVMNKGQIEEQGDPDHIYENPKTHYTKRLIAAIPKGI